MEGFITIKQSKCKRIQTLFAKQRKIINNIKAEKGNKVTVKQIVGINQTQTVTRWQTAEQTQLKRLTNFAAPHRT
jgi:hypothetical protein